MDAAVYDEVHDFWFGPLPEVDSFPLDRFPIWFGGGEAVDQDIIRRFGRALAIADSGAEAKNLTLRQQVGRIVLLDQMSRNIHRDLPDAYALDPLARRYSREVVAGGLDRFRLVERVFAILPLGHSEVLADQDDAVQLYLDNIAPHAPSDNRFYEACRIQSQKYRDIIAQFGRFPHRNEVLRRASTPQEVAFMRGAKLTPF
ncbi:DUF924 family protein [Devosia insulae]|uniref:DUF924 family protein n=1 Tax=Devosia insulae TaxID=408174 RepID=UPI00159F24E5|nr:DUF924 family protein [Devosia insulae]